MPELLMGALYAFELVILALMALAVAGKAIFFLKGLVWDNLTELFGAIRGHIRRQRCKTSKK